MNERDAMISTGLREERKEEIISVAPREKMMFLSNMMANIATARLTEIPFLKNEISFLFVNIRATSIPMGKEIKKAE